MLNCNFLVGDYHGEIPILFKALFFLNLKGMIVFRNLVIFLTIPIAEAGWQITCYEVSLFKSSVGRKLKKCQYLTKFRRL